jgi:chromate reductase, NAD(P)H dehydrogenase (quinone)
MAMRIVAISGSLQQASTNAALLDVARVVAPEGMTVSISDAVRTVPLFNPDLEPAAPVAVDAFRRDVTTADGLLIASPEYAHGVPGALKNALDWLVGSGELYEQRVAIIAGSPRPDGGRHVRADLERTLRAQGALVATSVTIPAARHLGPAELTLDPDVRRSVAQVLTALAASVGDTPSSR